MTQKEIEHKALLFTTFMNCIITLAGLWIWRTTGIQALFLDFFFSFIALLSTVMASIISKVSIRKTKTFPNGLHFLEPLYAILKTTLIVSLLISSVFKTGKVAYQYFKYGTGEVMYLTPVIPYTIIMFILCSSIAINNTIQNKKINGVSTMLKAEAKMNFIDGLQSLVIGLATFLLLLTDINGPFGFMYYTGDFFVTAILVAVTIKQPISEIIYAFREISGGVCKDKTIVDFINETLDQEFKDIDYNCNIYKEGMFINIVINLNSLIDENLYSHLSDKRESMLKEIREKYENTSLEFVF